MMTKKFFWTDAKGLKADIQRHRNQEQELIEKIAELESTSTDSNLGARSKEAALRVYRGFLHTLQQSKAEVVSKIGKSK